jgi:hypothetical protein
LVQFVGIYSAMLTVSRLYSLEEMNECEHGALLEINRSHTKDKVEHTNTKRRTTTANEFVASEFIA